MDLHGWRRVQALGLNLKPEKTGITYIERRLRGPRHEYHVQGQGARGAASTLSSETRRSRTQNRGQRLAGLVEVGHRA
jgi:hypothetical protein